MPYWLESDTFHADPLFVKLAGGRGDNALYDRLKASYVDLKSYASHNLTNGYLLEYDALKLCRGQRRVLELLCSKPLDDREPLLHRKGDVCDCLGDWVDGYDLRIHAFLRRNPARAEVERNRAQKADLRDPRLKALVYQRDGGCCRYCRSGPLSPKAVRSRDRRKVLTYDHVDPDKPAGPDGEGLVVACGACNEWKGHRTPDEADMALLEPPSPAEATAWEVRGLAVFARPDHRRITDESPTDQRPITDPNSEPFTDPNSERAPDPIANGTGELRPEQGEHDQDQPRDQPREGAGLGRAAAIGDTAGVSPSRASPAQPPRTSTHPDIYTRRSRAPTDPDYVWPAGSVPATPRDREEGPEL